MHQDRNNSVEVVISSTGIQHREGLTYLESQYANVLRVTLPPPEYLCIAYRNGVVCGTLGIMTGTPSKPLRLFQAYQTTEREFPFRIPLEKSVEFGRWTSESSWISAQLIHAAILHSLQIDMSYVWCEHTPSVHRVARRFGIVFYLLSKDVNTSMIEEPYAAYYASNNPALYVFELTQAKEALHAHIASRATTT
jgi:hypothetical protein